MKHQSLCDIEIEYPGTLTLVFELDIDTLRDLQSSLGEFNSTAIFEKGTFKILKRILKDCIYHPIGRISVDPPRAVDSVKSSTIRARVKRMKEKIFHLDSELGELSDDLEDLDKW